MKEIVTGSKAFFGEIEGFSPRDLDVLIVGDEAGDLNDVFFSCGYPKSRFYFPKMDKGLLLGYMAALEPQNSLCFGALLTKDFSKEYGVTIDDLRELANVADSLRGKHKYLKVIYDAYLENNDFALTKEQRLAAYEEYRRTRVK